MIQEAPEKEHDQKEEYAKILKYKKIIVQNYSIYTVL